MNIFGGYKTQTVTQLANVLSAFELKNITLRQCRVYFACLVITAAREAAERSRLNVKRSKEVTSRYLLKELCSLTGCPITRIRGEVKNLESVGLLLFTESAIIFTQTPLPGSHALRETLCSRRSAARPIPLSRPLLRFLASCTKASTVKTALAYAVRGLTLSRTGEVGGKGSVKATWIAKVMGLSERSVRNARLELLELELLFDDEGSKQWKLNRDGAYFEINLMWGGVIQENSKKVINPDAPVAREGVAPLAGAHPSPAAETGARVTVDNFPPECRQIAPPMPENCRYFAPPYKDKKTLNRSKNQKTRGTEPAGVCKANVRTLREELPKIYDVQSSDLGHFGKVEQLYFQAVERNLIEGTEAGAINFLAAAVRAKAVPGDPSRVFMGIIRKKLWANITQADEDRALSALKRYRETNPNRFRYRTEELRNAA